MESFDIVSPHSDQIYRTVGCNTPSQLQKILQDAQDSQKTWKNTTLDNRLAILRNGVSNLLAKKMELAEELTQLIGRPIRFSPLEIEGFASHANYLLDIAKEQLAPVTVEESLLALKRIVKEPLGVVLIIAAWNYPYFVVVNTLIPSLAAGNSVIIKHAPQTAPVADRIVEAFAVAGLPHGVLSSINLTNEQAEKLVADPAISYVSFVGSVRAGQAVLRSAAQRPDGFTKVSLELGGCDAAYVREDADVDKCLPLLVEGALFNSGQSCCGVQRIYVAKKVWSEQFVERFTGLVAKEVIGDPLDEATTIGPLVTKQAADRVREALRDDTLENYFSCNLSDPLKKNRAYYGPKVIIDPQEDSTILNEEIFGPVVAISPVNDDEDAIRQINRSPYGLTASIWTKDMTAVENIAPKLEVGTVFANTCDTTRTYRQFSSFLFIFQIDPGLPWGGQKRSAFGFSLSKFGYDQVTRLKALNWNMQVK